MKISMNFRGSLNTLILQNLKKGPNHGYRIAQEIKQTSKGVLDFKEGTLYPALHGLENQGLIESVHGRGKWPHALLLSAHGKREKEPGQAARGMDPLCRCNFAGLAGDVMRTLLI